MTIAGDTPWYLRAYKRPDGLIDADLMEPRAYSHTVMDRCRGFSSEAHIGNWAVDRVPAYNKESVEIFWSKDPLPEQE